MAGTNEVLKKVGRFLAGVLSGAVAGATAVVAHRRYQRDIGAARERVLAGGQQVIETAGGPLEFAIGGTGPPVLVVHGAGGGYDQGRTIARLAEDEFRWIAMSRFGYLGTPLPADASPEAQADASPEAQADAFVTLLDALDIPRAAVIGVSAGGPAALQFALRYPDRCRALVLVSAVSSAALPRCPILDAVYRLVFRWDFGFWLMLTIARPALLALIGIMPAVQARLSPAEKDWLLRFLQTVLPVSLRWRGLFNDMTVCPCLPCYPLERIAVPALVIHAADDFLIPLAHGEFAAHTIPDAELVTLPDGGHLLLGWQEEVGARVIQFLRRHMPERP